MNYSTKQTVVGSNNLQAARDLYQIGVVNILDGLNVPADLDASIHKTAAALEELRARLGKHEGLFSLWLCLIIVVSILSVGSAFAIWWPGVVVGSLLVTIFGLRIQHHSRVIPLLKIDRDAHQKILALLCRKKILARAG